MDQHSGEAEGGDLGSQSRTPYVLHPAGLVAALLFLTRLPVPAPPGDLLLALPRAPAWFPLVGLLIGALLAGLDRVLRLAFAPSVADALLLVGLALLTGGLHYDGLADAAAGLAHPGPPSERLAAMRASAATPAGALALIGLLLLQYHALGALGGPVRSATLVLAPALGRWAIVLAYAAHPYARPGRGASQALKAGSDHRALAVATGLVGLASLALLHLPGPLLLAPAGFAALALGRLARTRLGGVTGDVCGAAAVIAETLALVGAPLAARLAPGVAL